MIMIVLILLSVIGVGVFIHAGNQEPVCCLNMRFRHSKLKNKLCFYKKGMDAIVGHLKTKHGMYMDSDECHDMKQCDVIIDTNGKSQVSNLRKTYFDKMKLDEKDASQKCYEGCEADECLEFTDFMYDEKSDVYL